MITHPSYSMRNDTTEVDSKTQKQLLNDWFKKHAITKVTNKRVYYRDAEFNKKMYFHGEYNDHCFIKTNDESNLVG